MTDGGDDREGHMEGGPSGGRDESVKVEVGGGVTWKSTVKGFDLAFYFHSPPLPHFFFFPDFLPPLPPQAASAASSA